MQNTKDTMSTPILPQHNTKAHSTSTAKRPNILTRPSILNTSPLKNSGELPNHSKGLKVLDTRQFLKETIAKPDDAVEVLVLNESDFSEIVADEKTLSTMINSIIDNSSVKEIVVNSSQIFPLEDLSSFPVELVKSRKKVMLTRDIKDIKPLSDVAQPILDEREKLEPVSNISDDSLDLKCEEPLPVKAEVSTTDNANEVKKIMVENVTQGSVIMERTPPESAKEIAICRTCLTAVPSNTCTKLFDSGRNKKVSFELRQKLFSLAGFVDVHASSNPVVCKKCFEAIQTGFTFQKRVRAVEEQMTKLRKRLVPVDLKVILQEAARKNLGQELKNKNASKSGTVNLEKYLDKQKRINGKYATQLKDEHPESSSLNTKTTSANVNGAKTTLYIPASACPELDDKKPLVSILNTILQRDSADGDCIFEIINEDKETECAASPVSSSKPTVPNVGSVVPETESNTIWAYSMPNGKSFSILGSSTPFLVSAAPSLGSSVPSINSVSNIKPVPNGKSTVPIIDTSIPLILSTGIPNPKSTPPIMNSIPFLVAAVPSVGTSLPGLNSVPNRKSTAQIMDSSVPIFLSAIPSVASSVPTPTSAVPGLNSSVPSIKSVPNEDSTVQFVNSPFPMFISTVPMSTSAVPGLNSSTPSIKSVPNEKPTVPFVDPSLPIFISTVPSTGSSMSFVASAASNLNSASKRKSPIPDLTSSAQSSVPNEASTIQIMNSAPILLSATPSLEPSAPVAASIAPSRNSAKKRTASGTILVTAVPKVESRVPPNVESRIPPKVESCVPPNVQSCVPPKVESLVPKRPEDTKCGPIIHSNILLSDDLTLFDVIKKNSSKSPTMQVDKKKLSLTQYHGSSSESFLARRQERCKKLVASTQSTDLESKSADAYNYLFNTHVYKKRKPSVPATRDLFDEEHDRYFQNLKGKAGCFMVQKWKRLGQEVDVGHPPYLCEDCGTVCNNRQRFNSHKARHRGSRLTICSYCGVQVKAYKLSKHVLRAHRPRQHECKECGKRFHLKKHLAVHVSKVHAVPNQRYPCHVCGVLLLSESLAIHLMKHGKELTCDACPRVFQNRSAWIKHRRRHLSKSTGYVCDICSMPAKTNQGLKNHVAAYHLGGKTKKCPICLKVMPMRQSLVRHVKLEHGPEPWLARRRAMKPTTVQKEETQELMMEEEETQQVIMKDGEIQQVIMKDEEMHQVIMKQDETQLMMVEQDSGQQVTNSAMEEIQQVFMKQDETQQMILELDAVQQVTNSMIEEEEIQQVFMKHDETQQVIVEQDLALQMTNSMIEVEEIQQVFMKQDETQQVIVEQDAEQQVMNSVIEEEEIQQVFMQQDETQLMIAEQDAKQQVTDSAIEGEEIQQVFMKQDETQLMIAEQDTKQQVTNSAIEEEEIQQVFMKQDETQLMIAGQDAKQQVTNSMIEEEEIQQVFMKREMQQVTNSTIEVEELQQVFMKHDETQLMIVEQDETQQVIVEQDAEQQVTDSSIEEETQQATEFIMYDLQRDKLEAVEEPKEMLIYDSIVDGPTGVEEIEVPYSTMGDMFFY